jgi:hypothetical protein
MQWEVLFPNDYITVVNTLARTRGEASWNQLIILICQENHL